MDIPPGGLKEGGAGDEHSVLLEEALQRFLPRLRAYARLRMDARLRARLSASDVVQSVCIGLLDPRSGFEYRGEAQLQQWLYRAVQSKLCSIGRMHHAGKRAVEREVENADGDLALVYGQVVTPSEVAMGREWLTQFEAAFDALPEHYREVITLTRIIGLTQQEVAREMGRSVASTRNLLSRALARLASIMDDGNALEEQQG